MSLNCKTSFPPWLKENIMFILLLVGVILGGFAGFFANEAVQNSKNPTPKELAMFISFPGELFLRMLQLLVLPFVTSSVIISLANLDNKSATKLGKTAFMFFIITSLVAVVLAVTIATVFMKPNVPETHQHVNPKGSGAIHAILDLFRNMVPDNIVEASFSSTATKHKSTPTLYIFENRTTTEIVSSAKNLSSFLENEVVNPWSISRENVQVIKKENVTSEYDGQEKYNSSNSLGILIFSVVCGVILHTLNEEGKPMVSWFTCLFKVTLRMVDLFMWFSPVGIGCIIAGELAGMNDIIDTISSLGLYIAMVIFISLIHSLVILPIIYFVFLRKNPFHLLKNVGKPLLTALGTASSSASIPLALRCLETNHKLDPRVTQFVLPIGTTVNAHGSAIYIAVAAVYMMKIYHGDTFNFGYAILICLAATLASVAAAPIAGSIPIVTSNIVLQVIGISSADIGLILAVDWLLDRLTTPINVWACCVACAVVEHLSRDQLDFHDDDIDNCESGTECSDVSEAKVNSVSIDITEEVGHADTFKSIQNVAIQLACMDHKLQSVNM